MYGWANKRQERVLAVADRKRGQHEVTVLNSAWVQAIGWAQKSRRMMSTCMLLNRGGAKRLFMVTMYLYCTRSLGLGCIPNWNSYCSGSKLMNYFVVAFSSQQKSSDNLKYFLSDNWIILLSNYVPTFCEAYDVL